ncbi:MAG: hypothetical protein MNPFHGCM_02361 [Gemmatimonadaceae bacterium]|nr:hypothetical protein [Gemmatimonadaceae bacterium]
MTTAPRPSRQMDGKGRTVRELLAGRKYSIDYYQREYKWQQKQLAELIDDLTAKFHESHEHGNERSAVADYGLYFLGSIIVDTEKRTRASRVWKERVQALAELGKDEDADGIKPWLRSQYAESIRERKRDAAPQDFDLIGTEFHRWVRDHETALGLTASEFARFIERDFAFYARWYERLRRAGETLTQGLECVHFNAQHNFTLQYPVLLAPLRVEDDETAALRKLRVVAAYLDILIHRRIWNGRAIDYSTMQYAMFLVMRDVRGRSAEELAAMLEDRLDPETAPDFAANGAFRLHGMNGRQIHRLLARMTDYVETRSGQASRYAEYAQRGKKGYEIEHVWADHPERHQDEFGHPSEFQEYRNRIGGLVLLPKSFNASYGDLPYAEKRGHYAGQNLLARSLHESAYDHNPGFKRFIAESGLPFRANAKFRKADLDARQALYQQLAERIWSPERLAQEAAS